METHIKTAQTILASEEERHISMSNQLARAAHGLNLPEKRLIALGLAATDSVPLDNLTRAAANAGWKLRVTAHDYATAFGISPPAAYAQLKEASENLFSRYVRYDIQGRRGKTIEHKFRWISSVTYNDGEGYVLLNFSPEIAPHLLGLRAHFTTYKFRHAAILDNVYTWRLFEVLKSWQSLGFYATTIEAFADLMEAPASYRADFKQMRTRIIEPSVAAINEKTSLAVRWDPIRPGGRRIAGLEFHFDAPPGQPRLVPAVG
jgi:plasmid replication initiation protein